MANKNICDVDLLQSMSKNTNVIVDENGKVNKLNLYNEFNTVNTKIDDNVNTLSNNIAQLSNPNLLINGDFRNPINQRGQTSYTLDASARTYTIDRWCSANAIKVVLEDDGIHIYNTGSQTYVYLLQYIETPLIVGEKYTISAKINGVICSHTFIAGEGFNTTVPYFTYDPVSDSLAYDRIGLRIEDSYLVEYIKLEQGSIATPFVPRPYGEELALCQRYYIPYNGTSEYRVFIGGGHAEKTTEVYIQANIPSMRRIPTISYSDLRLLQVSGIPVTSMILKSYNDGKINLHCTVTGATATMYYTLAVNKGGYLIFDAEIY